MARLNFIVLLKMFFLLLLVSCQGQQNSKNADGSAKQEIWIYTSLYKDTIADLTPKLEAAFPGVHFNWFQAGSEEIAAKVNAEILSGGIKADLMISSDRFWYEELAGQGKLHSYGISNAAEIDLSYKHPANMYTTLSVPVMVISYNTDGIGTDKAPKTFKELGAAAMVGLVSSGSPLSSGTTFSTLAALQNRYGWDYFQDLKKNKVIMEGGNSAVIRRLQSKERPVGLVLMENVLRFKDSDQRLKFIIPEDGVILHNNVLAIAKKEGAMKNAEQIAEWLFAREGQEAMVRSFMYSPKKGFAAPVGAPALEELTKNAFPNDRAFLESITKKRGELKEKFTQIMYQ